jgi:hypothetical protein
MGVAQVWKSSAVARASSGLKVWNPRSRCAGWIVVVVGAIYVVPLDAPDVGAALALSALGLFTVCIGVCLVRGGSLRANTTGLELRRYLRTRRWPANDIQDCYARVDSKGLIYQRAYLVFSTRGAGDVAFNVVQWTPGDVDAASATANQVMAALRGDAPSA